MFVIADASGNELLMAQGCFSAGLLEAQGFNLADPDQTWTHWRLYAEWPFPSARDDPVAHQPLQSEGWLVASMPAKVMLLSFWPAGSFLGTGSNGRNVPLCIHQKSLVWRPPLLDRAIGPRSPGVEHSWKLIRLSTK